METRTNNRQQRRMDDLLLLSLDELEDSSPSPALRYCCNCTNRIDWNERAIPSAIDGATSSMYLCPSCLRIEELQCASSAHQPERLNHYLLNIAYLTATGKVS